MSVSKKFVLANSQLITKHFKAILAAFICLTILSIPFVSQLGLKANLMDLLPDSMASVTDLEELTNEVGGTSYVIAVVESPDEEATAEAAKQFGERAKLLKHIEYVDNRTDLSAYKYRRLLFLSLESVKKLQKKVNQLIGYYRRKHNPFFIDLLDEKEPTIDPADFELEEKVSKLAGFASKNREKFVRVLLLKPAHPISDFDLTQALFDECDRAFAEVAANYEAPLTLGLTGSYRTRYEEFAVIKKDLLRTGLTAATLVFLLLLGFFRRKRIVFLALICLGVGIFWTCAAAQMMIGYLNVISSLLLAILFGLGIDFAIHLSMRFEQVYPEVGDVEEAIKKTYADIGGPLMTSAITTSIAFFSLTVSRFSGFNQFGLIAGAGILLCYLSIFYGFPALLILSHRFKPLQVKATSQKDKTAIVKPGSIFMLILTGLLLSGYSVIQWRKAHFEYDFAALQEKNSPAITQAKEIGDYFGVVLNPVVLMAKNREQASQLVQAVNQQANNNPDTMIDFGVSISSLVPKYQEEKIEILKKIDQTLEKRTAILDKLKGDAKKKIEDLRDQLSPEVMTIDDLPSGLRSQYEGDSGASMVYVYPNVTLLDGRNAKKFVKELRGLDLPEGVTLAGEPVLYADILFFLEKDTPRAMLISLAVVVCVLFFHFRHAGHVLLVLAPVLLGFLWLIGFAVITKTSFNYLNLTILPSILGVGIDNGIHIFHRYWFDKQTKFANIMLKTGRAVILASCTSMVAFLSLLLAKHQGISSIGRLGFLGFLACLLTSVFFIPAVIEFFEEKLWKKKSLHRL